MHKKRSAALFERMVADVDGQELLAHSGRAPLIALCWLINLVPVLLVIAAGLIIYVTQSWIGAIIGLFLLALSYVQWPRSTPVPNAGLTRADAPELFGLVDEVASAIGCSPVSSIVLTNEYNAYVYNAGKENQQILTLGVPYFYILEPPARVGLLAHELGHFASDDPKNRTIVSRAIQILDFWVSTLRQDADDIAPGLVGLFANTIMFVLGLLPVSLRGLLLRLTYDDSQKAEYLADFRASRVAGNAAVLASTDALKFQNTLRDFLHKSFHAVDGHGVSLVEKFRDYAKSLPASERLRLSRCNLVPAAQIDTTHPPLKYLTDYVARLPDTAPVVVLTPSRSELIDAELKPNLSAVSEGLIADR
jgi:Zn-dependent protease with chaperone function